MKARLLMAMAVAMGITQCPLSGRANWMDQVDDSLTLQSPNGLVQSHLSGLLDLEGYYIDQRPPGLIFNEDRGFFNPRLSLFLDTSLGKHLYSFVQVRVDRGFDPGAKVRDARFDEYLLRYTPFNGPELNLQAGKFATVFGHWVQRHDSWDNPFITAPLPYENVTVIYDSEAPATPTAFLKRQTKPDEKREWVPAIWGPSYATGGSIFGRVEKLDYAVEIKNASLSSRPAYWDATKVGWENPTVSARVGYRPEATWDFGASFSHGAYMTPASLATLPAGKTVGGYAQTTFGQDISFAWRHWQVWYEFIFSRFNVPNVGNADTAGYFLEAKYKLTPNWFAALRWNQQFFDTVPDGAGGRADWDHDAWRMDAAVGYRFNRHLQSKLQYSFSHQKGNLQQGEQLVAAQVTLKF